MHHFIQTLLALVALVLLGAVVAHVVYSFFVQRADSRYQHLHLRWLPLESVTWTVFTYFASQYLAVLVLIIYPVARGWNAAHVLDWLENSLTAQFLTVALMYLLSLLPIRWFLRRRQTSFRAVGWNRKPKWLDLGYMAGGFAAYFISLNFFLFPLIKLLLPQLNFNQKQDIGFANAHGPILVLVFIALAVIPPLVEETIVRGFLYTGLRNRLPKYLAALIASLLFAVAHLELGNGQPALWAAAIDTFTLSLFLVYLRDKTDSLYASVGVHFLKNTLAFLALFVFHIV